MAICSHLVRDINRCFGMNESLDDLREFMLGCHVHGCVLVLLYSIVLAAVES
jgi:hypothetical protein